MTKLGVVVIGRNEGERLRCCLESVVGSSRPVVYVDSGSTDGSVELAQSFGVNVVELDLTTPFTAARARNAGVERLREVAPDAQFVQFVDGDCNVVTGWLDRGLQELESRPEVAVVCGRLRERFPERSIYNRLADLEWDTPVGNIDACGGIAMMRITAFQGVGGFDCTLLAGEEPELCARLRGQGWVVLRIGTEMTLHDMAMTRFGQWWRRQVRGGYGGLDVSTRFGGRPNAPFSRQVRRARIWTVGLAMTLSLIGGIGTWLGGSILGLSLTGMLALVPALQVIRLARIVRSRVESNRTALAYGLLTLIGKWAEMLGQLIYLRNRIIGRHTIAIGYKTPTAGKAI